MKPIDFEERLRLHSQTTRQTLNIQSATITTAEKAPLKKEGFKLKRCIILATAIVCLAGTTVFATIRLLNAKQTADTLGDKKLSGFFDTSSADYDTVTDGNYRATVLGTVSGENLSEFKSSSWQVFPERTYVVVAIEKSDGTDMTFDDKILVTPFIEGLSPMEYNVFTMNGGYIADIIDGVLYRIIEFDSVEYFADRTVYIGVLSETFLNNRAFLYDKKTGTITPSKDYDGTNILIELKLDKSKADKEKANAYLKKLKDERKSNEEQSISDFDESTIPNLDYMQ